MRQANPFTKQQYLDADCFQFEVPVLANALHDHTGGYMCNGCPKQNQNCESLKQLNNATRIAKPVPAAVETVRQEAARLGISINEVRRRRNPGAM